MKAWSLVSLQPPVFTVACQPVCMHACLHMRMPACSQGLPSGPIWSCSGIGLGLGVLATTAREADRMAMVECLCIVIIRLQSVLRAGSPAWDDTIHGSFFGEPLLNDECIPVVSSQDPDRAIELITSATKSGIPQLVPVTLLGRWRACVRAGMRVCRHEGVRACRLVCVCAGMCACRHACLQACMLAGMHACRRLNSICIEDSAW